MKKLNLNIRRATWNEVSNQYCNLPRVIEYKNKTFVISAGLYDYVTIFQYDKNTIAVLSTNDMLEYAGIELIDISDKSTLQPSYENSIFIQNTEELNKDFFQYSDYDQAKILLIYLQENDYVYTHNRQRNKTSY